MSKEEGAGLECDRLHRAHMTNANKVFIAALERELRGVVARRKRKVMIG